MMALVRVGSGDVENLETWYDTDSPIVPRVGEKVLIRGDDRRVVSYTAERVGYLWRYCISRTHWRYDVIFQPHGGGDEAASDIERRIRSLARAECGDRAHCAFQTPQFRP